MVESALDPEQFAYSLTVAEFLEPPQRGSTLDAVNAGVKLDAQALLDTVTLPDALTFGSLPEISNPFVPLRDAITPVTEASQALHSSLAGLKLLLGANSD